MVWTNALPMRQLINYSGFPSPFDGLDFDSPDF